MTRNQRLVLRAFSIWTVYVWGTRIWNTVGDDERSFAFKAVHVALALVSVVLAVAAWVVATQVQRRADGRERERASASSS